MPIMTGRLSWTMVAVAVLAATPAIAESPPSVADVQAAVQKTRPMSRLTWKFVKIAGARKASAGEAAHAGMPYPVIVYPVFVGFVEQMGSSRDVTWNYYIYKDDFGNWSATSNAIPSNLEGPLH